MVHRTGRGTVDECRKRFGPDSLPLTPTLGLAMGFTCIGLVPERERSRRLQRPWHDAVYWALVGTVLVLFVQQMLS